MSVDAVALVLAGIAAISLAMTLLADASVFIALSRRRRNGPTPPVSILKPVKGAEDGLYENLRSFALQDYPDFELLIGVEDPDDPALAVARRVQREHPGVRIRVYAGCRPIGLNPKVNLLAMLAERARHDHLLISDSNVRAWPTYLRDTAAEFEDPRVGLVTNLPVSRDTSGLGSAFESLHLNAWVAAAASIARVAAGRACVIGKSMLFRKSDFERLGGFPAVCNVLAEDYVIGRAFEQAGYTVALSSHVVVATTRGWTLERFANRHLRWAQMRRHLSLPAYLGELLLNPVAWTVLAVLAAAHSAIASEVVVLAAVVISAKAAGDLFVSRRLGVPLDPAHLVLVPLKDLVIAAIWAIAAFRTTVDWRGNRMRIGHGSELSRLDAEHLVEDPAQETA